MKKSFTAFVLTAAAALAFVSCGKEIAPTAEVSGNSVTLHINANASETKSVFGEKADGAYPVIWTTSKQVGFSLNEGALVGFAPSLINDGANASFDVTFEGQTATSGTVYAFSPKGVYDNENPSNNIPGFTSIKSEFKEVYLNIPSVQTPLANSVDENAQALYGIQEYDGSETEINMTFNHAVAYGKMAIKNFTGTISHVDIVFPKPVCGTSCWFYYSGDKASTIENANVTTITLNPDNVVNNVFWFACTPVAGNEGIMKVIIMDAEGKSYTKTIELSETRPLPFNQGRVSSFGVDVSGVESDIPADATFTIATIADANSWENGTAYNIASDDNGNDHIAISYTGKGNNGKYYTSDESWRLYVGGAMVVSSPKGDVITKIEISKTKGILESEGYSDVSGIWSGSTNSVSLSAKETTQIQKISVWYEPAPVVNVTGVSLDESEITLPVSGTKTLTATVEPANATNKNVTWTSSNESVATVSEEGVVIAVSEGTATITVTTEDGEFFNTCSILVTAASNKKYVKVSSTTDLVNGKYLIVCESQNVALNGALTADVTSNNIAVTISNGEIASTDAIDAAAVIFRAADGSFLGGGGKYIGHTGTSNTLNYSDTAYENEVTFDNGNAVITAGDYVLRYNDTSGQTRFRYYKSGQQAVQLYKYTDSSGEGEGDDSGDDTESGDPISLTFALSSNPGDWPTTNSTTLTNYTYTLDGTNYTFALKNVKCNSGYLMLTKTAVLGLPAIEGKKLTKVVAKNTKGCSPSVNVGLSSSASSSSYINGGSIQTWTEAGSTYTYSLSDTEANTVYYLYVTSANAQITELTLTYN